MPRVQLQVNGAPVEDWLADASVEFPDAEFRILATQPMDDNLLEIVEVTTQRETYLFAISRMHPRCARMR
ncbi:hypothetical protein ACFQL7_25020 [Halocatena marina]|uniref:Uncharacterized protein n=1 Tax=Halocatena marina TaxID=2934937 RepID=A0ABD5YUI3_9EURY